MTGPVENFLNNEGAGDSGSPVGSGTEPQGMNPAWNDLLGVVPQEYHEKMAPTLKQWDQNFQTQVQKVQSEYEPWKDIVKASDPDTVSFGINLLSALETNPQMVYDAMKDFYKFDDEVPPNPEVNGAGSTQNQGQEPNSEIDSQYDARFKQLEEHNELIAQALVSKQREELEAQEDAQLESDLKALQETYKGQGDFDEQFVLSRAQVNGGDLETAVKEFYGWRDNLIKSYTPKPLIMGSGGGLPNQNTDVSKLSDKDTKNLIVDMLNATNRANQ